MSGSRASRGVPAAGGAGGRPAATRRRDRAGRAVSYFDAMAGKYAAHYGSRAPAGAALRLRRDCVLTLLDRPPGLVLDIGCGPGEMAPMLRARGWRFWGVDLSRGMLAEARRTPGDSPGVAFAHADAQHLPFRDGLFDAVLAMGVLEYAADDVRALVEMARVLRPGGVLIFTLAHRWSPYELWRRLLYYPAVDLARPLYVRLARRPRPLVLYHVQRLYAEAWPADHLPRDLAVERVVYSNFKLLPAPLDRLLPGLDTMLMGRLERLGRGPLRHLGTTLVVKARKRCGG